MKISIKKAKKMLRIVFGRTGMVVLSLLLQVAVLFGVFHFLGEYMVYIYGSFTLLSVAVMIHILNEKSDPSFKLVWIIPVLIFPVFGACFYLFVQLQIGTKFIAKRLEIVIKETDPFLEQNEEVIENLKKESLHMTRLANYMNQRGGYPIYQNTEVTYFPLGEDKFEEMKKQLKAAKKFIFLEYFIVERGIMWNSILEILEEKVKEGVEVRFLYDGMCCMILLPYSYPEKMKEKGIKCKMFSPIKPALSTYQNNRDHRKILVIDGHTAFTGGVNLADEYINKVERFGHWKDTAIMLKGDAVKSFTFMFLQMWNINEREKENYSQYLLPPALEQKGELGFVMPYGDSPMDKESVGELVYMDILDTAKRYVHIMTPYLILDSQMIRALSYAAKSGVETVIIMPHIPDKIFAYLLASTYYQELLEAGVKIYEYTPGFVHAKVFVSDDEKAVVGTINLDFRSLYLHFECAGMIYKNPEVKKIEEDFQNTLLKCQEITIEECKKYPFYKKWVGKVLRLFAPLM